MWAQDDALRLHSIAPNPPIGTETLYALFIADAKIPPNGAKIDAKNANRSACSCRPNISCCTDVG